MRYLPLTDQDRTEMLSAIGAKSVDDLYRDVPGDEKEEGNIRLPAHQGEMEVERIFGAWAARNRSADMGPFFLGAGCYHHHIPASVDYIIQRSEFLTSYTPYQPEIAQGTLTAIFEFQTMIAQLTGQQVANASMYDGATACAEAALMALRLTGRKKILIGTPLNPQYRAVLESYLKGHGEIVEGVEADENTACVMVQSPDFFGVPHAYDDWRKKCDDSGSKLVVVITEIVSLGLLPAPSVADIVCGEAQSLGNPMSFGGPHLGFFACREEYIRQMPGRLCGRTVDLDGRDSFVLTLSTREQHIRREKATSNICTNQGLCMLAFTAHLALLGEGGLKHLARLNHENACLMAEALDSIPGVDIETKTFFNEFVVTLPKSATGIAERLAARNIVAGLPLGGNRLLVAVTETVSSEDMLRFVSVLNGECAA
jgi:glycine dehydrogenase subunit 1